jgi:hypothetical protein
MNKLSRTWMKKKKVFRQKLENKKIKSGSGQKSPALAR